MKLCPDDRVAELASKAAVDAEEGLLAARVMLRAHRTDPRLFFLVGSLLASLQRYDEATREMTEAVRLAPDFHIARFQLGLLRLSSGTPGLAEEVWRPLLDLPTDDPLRLFAEGLQHMAKDEFEVALNLLDRGIHFNREHPALTSDIQEVIERIKARDRAGMAGEENSSPAQWLLHQSLRQMKH